MSGSLQAVVDAQVASTPAVAWSIAVRSMSSGALLAEHDGDRVLPTASVGKLLLLACLGEQITTSPGRARQALDRHAADPVGDSGLWQHLHVDRLEIGDLAALVGAVSDNLATNVLLQEFGLDTVQQCGPRLGLTGTALHDIVRDVRGPDHAPHLSTGTAGELSALMRSLYRDEALVPGAGPRVLDWLALNTDLSMVGSGLGLDPLAHVEADRGLWLRHKTGTDPGVRADTGIVAGPRDPVAYAVIAHWAPGDDDPMRDQVLRAMGQIGAALRTATRAPGPRSR